MPPTDLFVPVADGVRLHVRHWPAATGHPFLLVHGLSSNARLWDETAERLVEAGHPVYAVDQRSHGESDAPEAGYDTATAAADLAALVGELGLPPAVVAGQSWGGNVVVRLAAHHPEAVAALALVDGGWIDLSSQFGSWEECARVLRPPDVDGLRPDDVRGFIEREHPDWSSTAVEATLFNLSVNGDGYLRRRLRVDRHMQIVRSMWEDPPWRDYPKIDVPVLLMPARTSDAVRRAAEALRTARIRAYDGADHDLHAQRPASVAADLLALAGEVDR
jgi:pimeloyl-ACP methyl ester carboxylesterase